MSRLEKLSAMEALWEDLSRDEQSLESPAWHADVLRQTERRVAAGEEKPLDWGAAKRNCVSALIETQNSPVSAGGSCLRPGLLRKAERECRRLLF
ncbi:MAG TPA: addiction module protein [Opitutaceae bacterium]|nr:addiction module protein [Opitutaceae bacterium]